MTEARQTLGKKGEDAACAYLERHGYAVCRRNYRCRYGEIDIIAAKGSELSFVEVKTRRNLNFGLPRLAVTYAKQQKIRSAALFYLQRKTGISSRSVLTLSKYWWRAMWQSYIIYRTVFKI